MGPPSTTAIQLHTCDKQEMRPDISRWHGEDRWVSRWQQAPLSRSLDILSLLFQCLLEHGSTSAQTESEKPTTIRSHRKCNDQSLIRWRPHHHVLFFLLFLHVFVFRISRSTCERIVVGVFPLRSWTGHILLVRLLFFFLFLLKICQ